MEKHKRASNILAPQFSMLQYMYGLSCAGANQIFKSNFPPLLNPPWRSPSAVVRPACWTAVAFTTASTFRIFGLPFHLYFKGKKRYKNINLSHYSHPPMRIMGLFLVLAMLYWPACLAFFLLTAAEMTEARSSSFPSPPLIFSSRLTSVLPNRHTFRLPSAVNLGVECVD